MKSVKQYRQTYIETSLVSSLKEWGEIETLGCVT
jgi:hypothetical protein